MCADQMSFELPAEIERCLFTLSEMYKKEGLTQLQEIIVNAKPRLKENTYSSWNGDSYGHTLHLLVPASIFPDTVDIIYCSPLRQGLN